MKIGRNWGRIDREGEEADVCMIPCHPGWVSKYIIPGTEIHNIDSAIIVVHRGSCQS